MRADGNRICFGDKMSAKQVCIALIRAARLLSLVLALASLIASRGEEFFYTTNNGTATITGCIDFGGGAMVIPSTIDGVLVTGIGPDAFAFGNMSSVTIPGHSPVFTRTRRRFGNWRLDWQVRGDKADSTNPVGRATRRSHRPGRSSETRARRRNVWRPGSPARPAPPA